MSSKDWADVEGWFARNNSHDSVTVKNGTADDYTCYVMLKNYKDITKIKEIRVFFLSA